MKRLPRRTARRIFWIAAGILICAILISWMFPAAHTVFWVIYAVLLAVMLVLSLTVFRCPKCGCLMRVDDKYCPKCGCRPEEDAT